MKKLKNSRWTKVHQKGQGNFETHNNVMDITLGSDRAIAEVLYQTNMVRTYEKAAYWLFRSLKNANALEAVAQAAEEVQAKANEAGRDDAEVAVSGEGWSCTIEKLSKGVFKVQMSWTFEAEPEQLTIAETTTEEPAAESPASEAPAEVPASETPEGAADAAEATETVTAEDAGKSEA